ncbi:hypothetical protein Tco_0200135 [Tanacetum coccineum]
MLAWWCSPKDLMIPIDVTVLPLISVSEIDEDDNQAKDRYKVGIRYHAVPPPYIGNYMPLRADLSFAGLDDSVFKFKISETRASVNENESIASKSSEEIREEPRIVRSSAPIIEDWESDSEDECVAKSSTEQDKSSNDNSVKSNECTRKYVFEKYTNNHDENLRKRQDSRVDWNGMKTQKLGIGFEFNKRACFGKSTGQREVRQVWNNARRVNHKNFCKMTHPHPKRNFVPTAFATKSGHVLVNAAKQNSAASTSTARPKVNAAAIRPNVNAKPSYGKNVTTARPKAVVSVAEGKRKMMLSPHHAGFGDQKKMLLTISPKTVDHTLLKDLTIVKTTSWNDFSSTMASAIICLATNQKFNFSKYILLNLIKNIEAGVQFYMFPRFVQLINNRQLGDLTHHKGIFDNPSLTKKVFANMKRVGIGFSAEITPLFDNMLIQAPKEVEPEGPPTEPQTKQDIPFPSPSYDPLPSGEDSLKLKELMDLCTSFSSKVLDLKSEVIDIKSTHKAKVKELKCRVAKLEEENRMLLKEIKGVHFKVDSDEPVMKKEESSKQGRKIQDIDHDTEINLVKDQAEM